MKPWMSMMSWLPEFLLSANSSTKLMQSEDSSVAIPSECCQPEDRYLTPGVQPGGLSITVRCANYSVIQRALSCLVKTCLTNGTVWSWIQQRRTQTAFPLHALLTATVKIA